MPSGGNNKTPQERLDRIRARVEAGWSLQALADADRLSVAAIRKTIKIYGLPKPVKQPRKAPDTTPKGLRAPHPCHCGDHYFIGLTRAGVALVSPQDVSLVGDAKWTAKNGYAIRSGSSDEGHPTIRMHSLILGGQADHASQDRSDNRRSNIRLCTHSENMKNRNGWGAIKFKGVSSFKDGRFRARLQHEGRTVYLGHYATEEEAARAYDRAAREIHGEFARTNAMLGLLPAEAA